MIEIIIAALCSYGLLRRRHNYASDSKSDNGICDSESGFAACHHIEFRIRKLSFVFFSKLCKERLHLIDAYVIPGFFCKCRQFFSRRRFSRFFCVIYDRIEFCLQGASLLLEILEAIAFE